MKRSYRIMEMFRLPVHVLHPSQESESNILYEKDLVLLSGHYNIKMDLYKRNGSLNMVFRTNGLLGIRDSQSRTVAEKTQAKNDLIVVISHIFQMLDYIVPTHVVKYIGFIGSLLDATPRPHHRTNSRIHFYDRFSRMIANRYNGTLDRDQDVEDVSYVINLQTT